LGLIPTICEEVFPPRILSDAERMTGLAGELAQCGYNLANCAQRLGVFPRLGVNFWPVVRRQWTPDENDPVDTLLELFIDGHAVPIDRLRKHVSARFIDAVIETRLADRLAEETGSSLQSRLCLFPCYGKFIVTDRAMKNTAINQVMWLWGESYILGGLVKRLPRRRAIDLGTGSGIQALLASDHCESVVGVDINPRALEFAKFNAALNGIGNVEFIASDLFHALDSTTGSTFDLLLANPPYLPDGSAQAGDNFWSGGIGGSEILRRIVAALPSRLDNDGAAHLVGLYPSPPGTTTAEHFDRWLRDSFHEYDSLHQYGALHKYEVLDHTWPVPYFQDMLSAKPFVGDKSAWRFGVISLRRAASGKGWWKHVAGNGLFFREDGSCCVVSDHDSF
jgi:SAM-dependent methyltransferase